MNEIEEGFNPEKEQFIKLTRKNVEAKLEQGESLENLNLADLDLAGLNFENKSFRGSDVRGIRLWIEEKKDGQITEVETNIKGTDWTDATFADFGYGACFKKVQAKGAAFGYSEGLITRRQRFQETGITPKAEDTDGFFGFDASYGNFEKTRWVNIDFGGGSGFDPDFSQANLTEAMIEGCDLSEIDLSTTEIDKLKIKNPVSLQGLKINKQQLTAIAQAIELDQAESQTYFLRTINELGEQQALEENFGIIVVEKK